jgi:hypothetical protein
MRAGEQLTAPGRLAPAGLSLLQVTPLITPDIAGRLKDTETNDSVARRGAGMFPVAFVDGKLLAVG